MTYALIVAWFVASLAAAWWSGRDAWRNGNPHAEWPSDRFGPHNPGRTEWPSDRFGPHNPGRSAWWALSGFVLWPVLAFIVVPIWAIVIGCKKIITGDLARRAMERMWG
jgi:hypothetical protein